MNIKLKFWYSGKEGIMLFTLRMLFVRMTNWGLICFVIDSIRLGESVSVWVSEWFNEWVVEWVVKWVSGWVSGWVVKWVSGCEGGREGGRVWVSAGGSVCVFVEWFIYASVIISLDLVNRGCRFKWILNSFLVCENYVISTVWSSYDHQTEVMIKWNTRAASIKYNAFYRSKLSLWTW